MAEDKNSLMSTIYGVFMFSREVEFGLITLCQEIPCAKKGTLELCSFLIAMNKSRNITD